MIYINNCKLLIINRCKDIKKYQLLNYSPLPVPPTIPIPPTAPIPPTTPISARADRTPPLPQLSPLPLPVRLAPHPSHPSHRSHYSHSSHYSHNSHRSHPSEFLPVPPRFSCKSQLIFNHLKNKLKKS